jgi:hypothetical protein
VRQMMRIVERWRPSRKLRHPCPDWRFDVMTRGASSVRFHSPESVRGTASTRRPYRDVRYFNGL